MSRCFPCLMRRKKTSFLFTHPFSTHSHSTLSTANPNRERPSSARDFLLQHNRAITELGRQGRTGEAWSLFDGMLQRDPDSYASIITVYLKNNDLSTAEQLFRGMPQRNIIADSAMVHAYASAGRLDEARKLFDDMPSRNVFSWTSLVSGYFRCGLVDEATTLFQRMPDKNVVSWTTALLGYARNGLIDRARAAFDHMPARNTVAWTAMMKAYIDNGRADEACQLFYAMPQRNLYSWNTMILACLDDGRVSEAVRLFDSMPLKSTISWTIMAAGLARNGLIAQARDCFDRTPRKDTAAWNAMIKAYADEGLLCEASELFNAMRNRNLVTWNTLIDGYARNGSQGEALRHLILMLRSCDLRPDQRTITSLLTSCWGRLELAEAHALVILLGFEHDTSLSNALISMYSRHGDVVSAGLAFESLKTKDVVSWTAMILSYSYHGYGCHALHAFARMLRSGVRPDEITFVGVLSACSHAGLVKKGQMLFDSMSRAYGLEPKAEHYSCLIDILGRAGMVEEALAVVCKMPSKGQDAAVLGALLSACKLHGKVELAKCIAQRLIEVEPSSSGGYVLLGNAYAADGKWDEFAQVRKKMKQRQVRKEPGYSSVEIQGRNHEFFVGDRTHSQIEDVYKMIHENLLPVMEIFDEVLLEIP